MPDPNYFDDGVLSSQDDFDEAREEQRKFLADKLEEQRKEEENNDNVDESPTPAADLGEGNLASGGSEDAPGPSMSSDPVAAAERKENLAETGSTVSPDEVDNADADEKVSAKKPAAKKSAK